MELTEKVSTPCLVNVNVYGHPHYITLHLLLNWVHSRVFNL